LVYFLAAIWHNLSPPLTRIMHARLKVGDRLLMGGDAPPQFVSKPQGFCVSIMVDDPAEAERIFRELGQGGVVRMPIAETFSICRAAPFK
jgi:PhnB protein